MNPYKQNYERLVKQIRQQNSYISDDDARRRAWVHHNNMLFEAASSPDNPLAGVAAGGSVPTPTPTPSVTPTNTEIPPGPETESPIPTETPTQTPTRTLTPTPSSGEISSYEYSNLGTGASDLVACANDGNTFYGIRTTFDGLQIGDILYTDTNLNNPAVGFVFVSNSVIYYEVNDSSGTIISIAGLC